MTRPVRLQLSRKARFNLQRVSVALNGLPARSVARPGKFGNRYVVRRDELTAERAVLQFIRALKAAAEGRPCPDWARRIYASLDEIRGHNLACWCRPGARCHADVLLELANPTEGDDR